MDIQGRYTQLREGFGNGDLDRRSLLGQIGWMAIGAGAEPSVGGVGLWQAK